jgi:hypothetical protein
MTFTFPGHRDNRPSELAGITPAKFAWESRLLQFNPASG